jgi:hypothetical protein
MSRNMMGALALAAVLGTGYTPTSLALHVDPETEAKLREEREAAKARAVARSEARAKAHREDQEREIARIEAYQKGIDPTNGRPLSRQQRRAIARKGAPRK